MLDKSTTLRVAEVFFQRPTTALLAADIARATSLSRAAVAEYLQTLQKQGIITRTSEHRGSRVYPKYTASRDALVFRREKMVSNLDALWPLIDFLIKTYEPTLIILFGSYRRGEDIESSDIDIFIETDAKHPTVSQFDKQLGRTVSLYSAPSLTEISGDLKNNLINGIVLHGYIDLL